MFRSTKCFGVCKKDNYKIWSSLQDELFISPLLALSNTDLDFKCLIYGSFKSLVQKNAALVLIIKQCMSIVSKNI